MASKYLYFLIIFVLSGTLPLPVHSQNDNSVSQKVAKKWMKSREWANGTILNVQKSVNAVEFYKQYHADASLWQKVFSWLNTTNLDTLSKGKYIIDGDNAYATITEAPSRDFDKTNWESHRNYTDLQYVIKGREKIGVIPIEQATVTKPYDDKKDAANYTAEGTYYVAAPGTFYLFFPDDAHRPNIKVEGYDVVKKLVIKIRYIK